MSYEGGGETKGTQSADQKKAKQSGFDLGVTIDWYEKNMDQILNNLPEQAKKPIKIPIENGGLVELSSEELEALWLLFPEAARDRSIVRSVKGQPMTWFHKDSTSIQPIPTTESEQALSSTAIIPSYVDYTRWRTEGQPAADIWLYKLPENVSPKVKKVISSEGFIHEVAHTIISPILYSQEYKLQLPNGQVVDAFDYLMQFANMAESKQPISHYASTYRTSENKFVGGDNPKRAIDEELAETVTAHLLHFAFCHNDARGLDPMADRPEIKQWVKDFLNARKVG